MVTMKSNIQTRLLITELRKAGKQNQVWKRIANELEKPTRQLCSVNLWKIEKETKDGEIAVVPGKVLATGTLSKPVTVAAFQFSKAAREKIAKVGKTLTLHDLLTQKPKVSQVRILK